MEKTSINIVVPNGEDGEHIYELTMHMIFKLYEEHPEFFEGEDGGFENI